MEEFYTKTVVIGAGVVGLAIANASCKKLCRRWVIMAHRTATDAITKSFVRRMTAFNSKKPLNSLRSAVQLARGNNIPGLRDSLWRLGCYIPSNLQRIVFLKEAYSLCLKHPCPVYYVQRVKTELLLARNG